jgi:hypothetical protein
MPSVKRRSRKQKRGFLTLPHFIAFREFSGCGTGRENSGGTWQVL